VGQALILILHTWQRHSNKQSGSSSVMGYFYLVLGGHTHFSPSCFCLKFIYIFSVALN